ncbi:hypothetical protein PN498_17860 [Oscillatoria sp. CS-180]|uniref:hypothetical protein n=1 Tax=Oscillatoria sp. CS-180 TaxID=3021720 RepID=UPI00232E4CC4|nr:hypothetical protein [Oscillatoria sp. CS-180]MDB9527866.1 hypothetical protein [Oscillatoria sp. CS-180]
MLEAFRKQPSLVIEPNGSLTQQGFEQLKKAAHFIQKGDRIGYIKAVFQSNPSLEYPLTAPSQPAQATSRNSDYTGVQRGGALVRRRPTAIAATFSEFDQAAADGELALMQEDIATQVENLDDLFSRYARARVQKAFTEIDHTVEAFKSNALAEMGVVAADPKEQAAHNKKEVT